MKQKILAIFLSFLLLITAGCSTARKPAPEQTAPQTEPQQQMTEALDDTQRRTLANKLSQMAESIEGVQKATVVVADMAGENANPANGVPNEQPHVVGPNNGAAMDSDSGNIIANNNSNGLVVMAGITLDQNGSDAMQVKAIEKTVADTLKNADPRISDVLVTSSPDLIKRINDVAAGIIEGKPIKTFQQDVDQLTQSIKQGMQK